MYILMEDGLGKMGGTMMGYYSEFFNFYETSKTLPNFIGGKLHLFLAELKNKFHF